VSLWLSILFVAVGTLLIGELIGAALRRWRSVIVLDSQTRHQLRAWPLRIVAMFSAAAVVVLRGNHAVVDGRTYTKDHILPGQDAAVEPESLALFQQYPLHRHTTVFYDPDDPACSALDLDPDELVLRPILLGAIGVVLAGVWLWMMLSGWP
jgi:hypothetical protein